MRKSFKSPLTLYVLWHPEYSDGSYFAHKLFNVLSRNVDDPFSRTPGIPVYFRSAPGANDLGCPRSIPFEESEHCAIVILVDDQMVISEDWSSYVQGLDDTAASSEGKIRIFPVATSTNSYKFPPVSASHFIRLFEGREDRAAVPKEKADDPPPVAGKPAGKGEGGVTVNVFIDSQNVFSTRVEGGGVAATPPEEAATPGADEGGGRQGTGANHDPREGQATFLMGKLVHELSRLLYHHPRTTEEGTTKSAPPIQTFISHAKVDGTGIAAAIRDHIHSDTSLKSFFDSNDIAVGYRFPDELLSSLEESAVICLQTDYYATREWCLWEVINAKRLDRPVVVVNAVTNREPRSFPYIGNVPTIRWRFGEGNEKAQIQDVLDMTLFEVLGTRFREMFQKELIRTFDLPANTGVVGHPPELFTILKMASDGSGDGRSKEKPRYVVYPDPPLGDEELRLLHDLAPQFRFVTPTMLPLVQQLLKTESR